MKGKKRQQVYTREKDWNTQSRTKHERKKETAGLHKRKRLEHTVQVETRKRGRGIAGRNMKGKKRQQVYTREKDWNTRNRPNKKGRKRRKV